uniref:Nardilysin b (N-arginine dibasic convertase) n=1 Tax=Astyanax mexicanus TaxID=7994 RepID=W5LF01_ASTMX
PEPRASLTSGDNVEAAEKELEDLQIIKSPSDPKKYRYIELNNGLKALLISDQSREHNVKAVLVHRMFSLSQSAAALCICVGSFSDPEDLPGLAHFLEHMVFMGSEKYPAENGFDAFLKKHGGSDNASTDCERTIFQFDVQRKYFREALDRWAQFFICPLMIEDAIDREVEAVDSEYQLARPSDSHRKEMLFGSLAKPNHPMTKFCWGNAQTLKHEPKENKINTYERLREFWKRYYSAHYMTLTVQSRETLDTLEEWVREIFIKVPNNGQPRPDFSNLQDPFNTPDFNKLYRVVPVRKIHALTISWALPPQDKHYRVKPLHYISWLIGHEGAGSILSVLRKKCWALALFGGNSETGFDQNTTYSIFSISITLTDEGYQNVSQIVHLVFQYLKMLQKLGTQQRIYEEIQKIEANEFHYQEQTDPIEFVETICENMQLFPKQDFLCGHQLMFEYNPETSLSLCYTSLLTPERANLLLLSPEHEGRCLLKEKWFGTQYSMEAAFLVLNFDTQPYMGQHLSTDSLQKNCVPFVSPQLLLNLIVDYLADFTAAPDVFSMFAEQLKKTYFNILIKPERLGKDVRLQILEHCRWSVIQKYEAIMKNLTVDDLMQFVTKFKAKMFVEGLVQGNFTSAESKEFLEYFVERLQFKPLEAEPPVLFRVVELPQKHHLCKVQSLNKSDANSEVTVYYQVFLMPIMTSLDLLRSMHMEEPCFDFLRTKETLGYQVYPTCRNTSGVLGFSVTVETQATKFSTDFVENKIEEFLVNFGEKLTNLTDEAYQAQVTALIKLKECEDTHLGEEVDRSWFEVVTEQYVFDGLSKEIEALKQMTKAELLSWFMGHRGAEGRKLSVHVVGFGKEENNQPEDDQTCLNPAEKTEGTPAKSSSYGEVSKLTFLPPTSALAGATMITDIRAFTSSLTLHPYHKILS